MLDILEHDLDQDGRAELDASLEQEPKLDINHGNKAQDDYETVFANASKDSLSIV